MNRAPLLCIAGGGTGGHVMPALALADAARERWPALQVSFIGAERGLEAELLPKRGEQVLLLAMHGVKGAGLLQRLRVLCWELPKAVLTIRRAWEHQRPDLLVGVGGYASISGVAAALISHVPVILYEQNAMPGLVNRTLARFCKSIMLGFAEAAAHLSGGTRMSATGNIVRQVIVDTRWQAHTPPRLLVLGGSQGARVLNQSVPLACELLTREGRKFVVTHVAGKDSAATTAAAEIYERAGIQAEILAFCDDMPGFYGSGDLMVARSGAMTVSEAAVCGMPSLFVPLPHAADDHQRFNAESLANAGGAVVLEQKEMNVENLAAAIDKHLFDAKRLTAMHAAALAWAPFDASEKQLDVLAEFLPALAEKGGG
ncbi:MAG: undecaprenyldiphospho-muramoylpentapeptide beta-N-acetylglucosaminyltransferase [Zetaproteobacteria bacterium CG1_02_53_45]|nr:MAG: undecaprenyldiphospho-muramoylpentapeptide beta-N-acetylglucosaminyltransferase [Zetaproteobacteria bacterium CG1_02_53_45]